MESKKQKQRNKPNTTEAQSQMQRTDRGQKGMEVLQ